MTSNFNNARKQPKQATAKQMDSLQRDRFELISAYIDGEVTATERSQVQQWLATDPEMQKLHSRLLMLRQGLQKLPVPPAEQTAQETVEQVFSRVDRRRTRQVVFWGGGAAIAATFVTALSGIFPVSPPLITNMAQAPTKQEPLMIAVNRPVIDIPKAAVSSSKKFEQLPTLRHDAVQQ